MTKANITQYSATANSNTDIDDINIDENCPASGLNNALRSLMAHLKNVDTGSQALTALTVTGNVTVAGNIQKTSGDFTLDVAGDINLDSDSGYVLFKDGGTEHARIFQNNSGDVNIGSQISDKDMKFNGNDGGSAITALTLDMSDSGRAIFNSRAGINGGTNEGVLTVASSTASMATNGNAHITLQNTNQTTGNKGLINYKATADSGSGFIPLAFGGRVTDATNAGRKGAFCVYVADTDNVDVDNDERLRIDSSDNVDITTGNLKVKELLITTKSVDLTTTLQDLIQLGNRASYKITVSVGDGSDGGVSGFNTAYVTCSNDTATQGNITQRVGSTVELAFKASSGTSADAHTLQARVTSGSANQCTIMVETLSRYVSASSGTGNGQLSILL